MVLKLGAPELRASSREVIFPLSEKDLIESQRLILNLEEFREKNGFGRGIAAPQIGINKRIIALNLGEESFTIYNPEIIWMSDDEFEMWDDCMSFPDLLVKVKRYSSVSVRFYDKNGNETVWEKLEKEISELLQHEIDHLHGIMAIDRAIDRDSIKYKNP